MAYRKKTLRQLNPISRKLARTVALAQAIQRTMKNIVDEVNFLEREHEQIRRELIFKKKDKEAI
ncbi:MAG: hypothetical protein HZA11_07810 [Nitrospirae bacterium]|nr:hypothetical protein [Nitrospirota bacterium]